MNSPIDQYLSRKTFANLFLLHFYDYVRRKFLTTSNRDVDLGENRILKGGRS
jgi:hypothetical protein